MELFLPEIDYAKEVPTSKIYQFAIKIPLTSKENALSLVSKDLLIFCTVVNYNVIYQMKHLIKIVVTIMDVSQLINPYSVSQ